MAICKKCQEHPAVCKGMCRSCYDKGRKRRKIVCVSCGETKRHAFGGMCGACVGKLPHSQDMALKRTFGISLKDYDKMFDRQGGVCAICGREPVKQRLCVDHDHVTEEIRGLLCRPCNLILGNACDDVSILNNAIKYLRKV